MGVAVLERRARNEEAKADGRAPGLLICDHRGEGLVRSLAWLGDRGFAVEVTESLRETLLRLRAEPRPDLLIVDSLASAGLVELAAIDRRRNHEQEAIPLLVVTEPRDEAAMGRIDRALEAGPWDVYRRGAPDEELVVRLEHLLRESKQVLEMADLRHRAFHDDRTDLLRPLAFHARIVEHFSAAQRHHHDLALVLLDLDRFGQINKRHDHTVGDALISSVGDVIRRTLRTEDVAGRLGGDEFAVILPYTRKIDAARVVNRLREEIGKLSGRPVGARAHIEVSTSLGFETTDGRDLDSLETLRRHAERALRAAKVAGGDCGIYYRSLPEAEGAPPADPQPAPAPPDPEARKGDAEKAPVSENSVPDENQA